MRWTDERGHTLGDLVVGLAILGITSAVTATVMVTATRWIRDDARRAYLEAPARDAADMLAREIRQAYAAEVAPDSRIWPAGTLLLHVFDPRAPDAGGRRGQVRWVSYHLDGTSLVRRVWLPESYDPATGAITMASELVARRGLTGFAFAWEDPVRPGTLAVDLQVQEPDGGRRVFTHKFTPRVVGSE